MLVRLVICFILFSSMSAQGMLIVAQKPWGSPWRGKAPVDQDIQSLFQRLSQSDLGKILIDLAEKRAKKQNGHLIDFIKEGNASYTDFTMQREVTSTGVIKSQVRKVVIDRNTSVKRAVHDLAHELVHFIWQENIDPYDHHTHFADYLKKNIEGKGGEVDAFMVECKVARQLHPKSWLKSYPCRHITKNGKISKDLTVKAFYKVGDRKEMVSYYLKESKDKFPHLTSEVPVVIAGISSQPYPFSMLQEFKEMRVQVCKQEQKRLGRSPASEKDKQQLESLCEFSFTP